MSIEADAPDGIGVIQLTKSLDEHMPGDESSHSIAASYVLAFKNEHHISIVVSCRHGKSPVPMFMGIQSYIEIYY